MDATYDRWLFLARERNVRENQSEIDKALFKLDEAERAKGELIDKFIGASQMESRLRKAAKARGTRLPDWIADEMGEFVHELSDAVQVAQAEYQAVADEW